MQDKIKSLLISNIKKLNYYVANSLIVQPSFALSTVPANTLQLPGFPNPHSQDYHAGAIQISAKTKWTNIQIYLHTKTSHQIPEHTINFDKFLKGRKLIVPKTSWLWQGLLSHQHIDWQPPNHQSTRVQELKQVPSNSYVYIRWPAQATTSLQQYQRIRFSHGRPKVKQQSMADMKSDNKSQG